MTTYSFVRILVLISLHVPQSLETVVQLAGEALISGYCVMGLDDLWKPDLRAKIEASIKDVAEGRVSKEQVRLC